MLRYLRDRGFILVMGRALDASAIGLFSVAKEIGGAANQALIAPINRAVFPGYSRLANDADRLRDAYKSTLGLIAIVAVPASTGARRDLEPARARRARPAVARCRTLADAAGAGRCNACAVGLDGLGAVRDGATPPADAHGRHPGHHIASHDRGGGDVQRHGGRRLGVPDSLDRRSCCRSATSSSSVRRQSGSRMRGTRCGDPQSLRPRCSRSRNHSPSRGRIRNTWVALPRLLAVVLIGALVFTGCIGVLWHLAGRPEGAEKALLRRIAPRLERLRARIWS